MSSQCANSSAMIFARLGIVGGEVLDRLVGKNDAPAEGDSGGVALEHFDLVRGVAQLHRNGEVETRRPSADAGDFHAPRARSLPIFALTRTHARPPTR